MSTGWTINGLDLRRVGYNIRTNANWDSFPGTKIPRHSYGFRHGDLIGDKGFYEAKNITIALDIFATAPDGTITLTPEEHIQANIDSIMGALHAANRKVTVQRTFGATTREAQAVALRPVQLGAGFGTAGRTFAINLELPYPFWHELPQNNLVGLTGAQVLTNGGNAPIGDAVLTCTAAGRLTVDASGDWVEVDSVAGGAVTIDIGAGTIKQAGVDADGRVTQGQAWLPDFEPGTNNLTITGTWNIDFYDTFF